MNIEEFRFYCLSKPESEECTPFDESTLVFKVAGKMFALTDILDTEFKVNLKSDPEKAIELREQYEEIQPGYHMNKMHWNTVNFDGSLNSKFLKSLVDESYLLVVKSLKKVDRERILNMLNEKPDPA